MSTRERMSQIRERMKSESFIEFSSLFKPEEGKIGVVVTFLAILELLKDSLIEIVQSEEFGPIHIKGIEEVH
jgi:segregation and condensation protein A